MSKENIKKYIDGKKELCIFLLLLIWFIIPLLKEIEIVSVSAIFYEYIFMKLIGIIGIYLLIFQIYKNIKNRADKKEYLKENLPILILMFYMLWTLISSIFAHDRYQAFYGTPYRKEGYITYLIYAGFFGCAYLVKSKKLKKILLNIFIIVSIFTIIGIQLANQLCSFNIFCINKISEGVFYNSNHYGYYLLLVTMTAGLLFIFEKNKVLKMCYLVSYIFLLYYLILNNTLGCYIAMFFALVLFLARSIYTKQKIGLSILAILIFLSMSFIPQGELKNIVINNFIKLNIDIKNIISINDKEQIYDAGSGRMKLWTNGIQFFLQNPILGYGPENLEYKYAENNICQDRPHNMIIQLATTSGAPGLILYMCAIGIIIKRAIKNNNNDMQVVLLFVIVAYLVSSLFGNSMYYTSPYFFILLGFLMCENKNCI